MSISLLRKATKQGNLTCVQELLNNDPALVNDQDWEEKTPLHVAAENGHLAVTQLLLHHVLLHRDADIDAEDWNQETPLHLAALNGHADVTRLLLNSDALVDAHNKQKRTPLHYAASNGHLNVAAILLDHKATVDARDKYNQTPLHWTAIKGHAAVAIVLLYHNAAVDAQNNDNATPLHLASINGHANVEQLLKDWPDYQNAMIRMLREQQERVDILLLAQDSRSVDISPHFPQLCIVNIAKFACPELMKTKYSKLFSDDDLNQLGKLSDKNNPQEIHEIAEQERKQEKLGNK